MQTVGTICAASLAAGLALAGEPVDVPSGQAVSFLERVDREGMVHFRFLAPQISRDTGDISLVDSEPDMLFLCETFAVPRLGAVVPERVVITLADREVPFGEANPEATQFFEGFRVENGACIWEGF